MFGFGSYPPPCQLNPTLLNVKNKGDAKEKRDEVYDGEPHESHLSHEVVGGAAAFEAMKLFEDRQRKSGTILLHTR